MFFRHLRGIFRVGLKEYLRQVWYLREFRGGVLVGQDVYGNRYFEIPDTLNPNEIFYRKRYVELAEHSDEASKVPSEWHGWLHYTNDDAPSRSDNYVYQSWRLPHTQTLTGTESRYIPYSTTVRKIGIYQPNDMRSNMTDFLENSTLSDVSKGRKQQFISDQRP